MRIKIGTSKNGWSLKVIEILDENWRLPPAEPPPRVLPAMAMLGEGGTPPGVYPEDPMDLRKARLLRSLLGGHHGSAVFGRPGNSGRGGTGSLVASQERAGRVPPGGSGSARWGRMLEMVFAKTGTLGL